MNKHKVVLIAALAFLGLSSIHAQEKKSKIDIPWENGKLKVSENKRFLQHENGNPFFWLGETAWLLPSRSNRDEVDFFMNETQKNGYNVVQISTLHTVPAMNAYGNWALSDGFNFNNIDKKGEYNYWQHVDYIVKRAKSKGMYIGIVCVWGSVVQQKQL